MPFFVLKITWGASTMLQQVIVELLHQNLTIMEFEYIQVEGYIWSFQCVHTLIFPIFSCHRNERGYSIYPSVEEWPKSATIEFRRNYQPQLSRPDYERQARHWDPHGKWIDSHRKRSKLKHRVLKIGAWNHSWLQISKETLVTVERKMRVFLESE